MKTIKIFAGLSVAALAAAAGIATAQTAPSPAGPGHGWDRGHPSRDADNDGRISQAEFMGDGIARLTALDANRDGTVSVEERRAGRDAQRAERQSARFDRLDANKDGSVTRAEFDAPRADRAGRPDRAERAEGGPRGHHMRGGRGHGRDHGRMQGGPRGGGERGGPVVIAEVQAKMTERFAAIDTDRDGFLSAAEQTASREAMRSQWQERRAERRAARTANTASPSAPASE